MSSDFKILPTVNNVAISLDGHTHSGGVGFDADMVDGYHAAAFALLDSAPVFTGTVSVNPGTTAGVTDMRVSTINLGIGQSVDTATAINFYSDATVPTTYKFKFGRGAGADGISAFTHRGVGNFTFYAIEAASIVFGTSNIARLTIAGDGNVGIGITPAYPLDVMAGGINVAGATDGAILFRFATDRPWHFRQSGTLSGTKLQLKSEFDGKNFEIVKIDDTVLVSFVASTISPSVTFVCPVNVTGALITTANGQTMSIVGGDHTYMGFYPTGVAGGRKGYFGFSAAGVNNIVITNEVTNGGINFVVTGATSAINMMVNGVWVFQAQPAATFIANQVRITKPSLGTGVGGSDFTGGVRVRFSTGYGVGLDIWDSGSPRWGITRFTAGDVGIVVMEGLHTSTNVSFNAGNVGIGTMTPQGRLHVHDGVGGKIFTTKVVGASQTIVADGVGDVTKRFLARALVYNAGWNSDTTFTLTPGGANYDYTASTSVYRFTCSSLGAVTVTRVSGTQDATIVIDAIWF